MSGMGLGMGMKLSDGGVFFASPSQYFGAALVGSWDSDHVTTSGGNITAVTDQSGAGVNLVPVGTVPLTAGGVKGRPFGACVEGTGYLSSGGTRIVPAGHDRTVWHVFQAVAGTVALVSFDAAPTLAIRFSAGLGTTSDESTFNNTGTYTFDTTGTHVLEVQYSVGTVSKYTLDGVVITQAGATVSTSDSGAAQFFISHSSSGTVGGEHWYATNVINRLAAAADSAQMFSYLLGKY